MNNKFNQLQSLHVEGFWNRYTIDITFQKDVTILTGNNGVGKTTILDILYSLLNPQPLTRIVASKYRNAKLQLTNGYSVCVTQLPDGNKNVTYTCKEKEISYEEFSINIRTIGVSNFDSTLLPVDLITKMKESNPAINSDMDLQVRRWISIYQQYMTSISRRIEFLTRKGEGNINEVSTLFQYSRHMETLCRKFFEGKKEWHVTEEGDIQFHLIEEDKYITPEQLSSGEKQIVILLISTLIQNGLSGIVFWDEPEISLHISWQQKLISSLFTLNPNMQLIIATHSPNILYEGWEGKTVNVKRAYSNE